MSARRAACFCCSANELRAYLKRLRPDLCVLEGEGDHDEEGFVLIEDQGEEEEEEEMLSTQLSSDWEVSGFSLVSVRQDVKET